MLALTLMTGVMLVSGGSAGAVAGTKSTGSATGAAAALPSNHLIPGRETTISCMTPVRCVAVGLAKTGGQVVALDLGKQAGITTIRTIKQLNAVSCPSRSGCWALGVRRIPTNQVLVKIGPTGKVTKQVTVKEVQHGLGWGDISCSTMTSCELFGINSKDAYFIGFWNGTKMTRQQVPIRATFAALGAISCWRATCTAAALWTDHGTGGGMVVSTNHGKLGKVHTRIAGFYDVSCGSPTFCLASGYAGKGGGFQAYPLVDPVRRGVPGTIQFEPVPAIPTECDGTTCWALGGGDFLKVSDGVPGTASSLVVDPALNSVPIPGDITRRGTGFAAVGQAVVDGKTQYWESDVAIGYQKT
jgi:hypothetical protein